MNTWNKIKLFASLAYEISPVYILILFLRSSSSAGQIFGNVIFPKYLIDELMGAARPSCLLLFVGLIVLSNGLFYLLNRLLDRTHRIYQQDVSAKMWQALSAKIMRLPYPYLEDPEYLDLKERAVFVLTNQGALQQLIQYTGEMLKNLFTLLGLLVLMLTLSPLYVLILLGITALSLWVYRHFMHYEAQMYQAILPYNRRLGYYTNLTLEAKLQKDIRLYQMAPMLTEKVLDYNQKICRECMAFSQKFGLRDGILSILNDLLAVIAYAYTALRVIPGLSPAPLSLGSFTMYASSAMQFSTAVRSLWENFFLILQMLGYLDPFAQFMALPEEENQPDALPFSEPIRSIRFENVSFSYPKSDRLVLDHVSFSVKEGEKISIVGLNGAGKTTLVKLLCRLYEPIEGAIYVNDVDIRRYERASYLREIAAVFQDYKLFAYSLEENITGKDLGADTPGAMERAREVGLEPVIQKLPHGLSSFYGKDYDEEGIQISGGEGQKIAIARALYKDASLVILDEPTSALDPLSEAKIYEDFHRTVQGKTALYISHRMSSSTFCDKVLVLDHAKVAAFAPHQELMQDPESLYYQLFTAQAENYETTDLA